MWLFWKDIIPFEPGYISNLSRCWEEVAHLGVREYIKAGSEFSFLTEKRYAGKFAYIRKGCLHSFILLPDGSERLKLVVDEGSLIYEAYCSAGGCERETWHRTKKDVELVCFDGRLLHDPAFQKAYPLLIANVYAARHRNAPEPVYLPARDGLKRRAGAGSLPAAGRSHPVRNEKADHYVQHIDLLLMGKGG